MGRSDFAWVLGLAIADASQRARILQDPEKFAKDTNLDLSKSEVKFLKRQEIKDALDEFINKLDVKYDDENQGKGR
jgi:hypothetical protein